MTTLADHTPVGTPDPDRWQKALAEAERKRQEQRREEYSGTVWVSFRWLLPLFKRLFKR